MNEGNAFLRLTQNMYFWVVFMAFSTLLHFYDRYAQNTRTERYIPDRITYLTEPLLLPEIWLTVLVINMILYRDAGVLHALASITVRIVVTTALWFGLLVLLAPKLPHIISARGRAALWILPNQLYIMINVSMIFVADYSSPISVRIPGHAAVPLLAVWVMGAAAVMGWHLASHFRFRRELLQSARPELGDPAQKLWVSACATHKVRADIPLTRSAAVETPLSVGCFQKTMVLVLPEKGYTADELELIYRHELRHIKRADMRTKIWMALWKSLLWFFPPVWWAAKITAEDLELCCDEEVLTGAEPEERRRYAELLLDAAAPAAGFSTCLSADARVLGRRVKQAVRPEKVWRGDWIVGLAAGLLMLLAANFTIVLL